MGMVTSNRYPAIAVSLLWYKILCSCFSCNMFWCTSLRRLGWVPFGSFSSLCFDFRLKSPQRTSRLLWFASTHSSLLSYRHISIAQEAAWPMGSVALVTPLSWLSFCFSVISGWWMSLGRGVLVCDLELYDCNTYACGTRMSSCRIKS